MGLIIAAIISVIIGITILWVDGINYMKENYPDYKGEDFLNWDEDKNHTENQI